MVLKQVYAVHFSTPITTCDGKTLVQTISLNVILILLCLYYNFTYLVFKLWQCGLYGCCLHALRWQYQRLCGQVPFCAYESKIPLHIYTNKITMFR